MFNFSNKLELKFANDSLQTYMWMTHFLSDFLVLFEPLGYIKSEKKMVEITWFPYHMFATIKHWKANIEKITACNGN